jgi:hypothetical protein
MPDGGLAGHLVDDFSGEDVLNEACGPMNEKLRTIACRDAGGLLTAVLKRM